MKKVLFLFLLSLSFIPAHGMDAIAHVTIVPDNRPPTTRPSETQLRSAIEAIVNDPDADVNLPITTLDRLMDKTVPPLRLVADHDKWFEFVFELLRRNADPLSHTAAHTPYSALEAAANNGAPKNLLFMLKKLQQTIPDLGPFLDDLDKNPSLSNPLHLAVRAGKKSCVQLLLCAGMSVNKVACDGARALDALAMNPQKIPIETLRPIILALYRYGADNSQHSMNNEILTPVQRAHIENEKELADCIEMYSHIGLLRRWREMPTYFFSYLPAELMEDLICYHCNHRV